MGRMDASGNYESFNNQSIGNFSAAWSHLVALVGDRLLFYNIDTGLTKVG